MCASRHENGCAPYKSEWPPAIGPKPLFTPCETGLNGMPGEQTMCCSKSTSATPSTRSTGLRSSVKRGSACRACHLGQSGAMVTTLGCCSKEPHLSSEAGVQQGDPLGPLLFALALQPAPPGCLLEPYRLAAFRHGGLPGRCVHGRYIPTSQRWISPLDRGNPTSWLTSKPCQMRTGGLWGGSSLSGPSFLSERHALQPIRRLQLVGCTHWRCWFLQWVYRGRTGQQSVATPRGTGSAGRCSNHFAPPASMCLVLPHGVLHSGYAPQGLGASIAILRHGSPRLPRGRVQWATHTGGLDACLSFDKVWGLGSLEAWPGTVLQATRLHSWLPPPCAKDIDGNYDADQAPPCTRSTSRSHLPTTSRSQPRTLLGNKSCHARWTGLWSRSWPRLALGEKLTEPISNSCSKKGQGPGSTLFQTMPWASMWSLPSSEPWSACGFACLLPILTWLALCVMALQIALGTTPVCAPAGGDRVKRHNQLRNILAGRARAAGLQPEVEKPNLLPPRPELQGAPKMDHSLVEMAVAQLMSGSPTGTFMALPLSMLRSLLACGKATLLLQPLMAAKRAWITSSEVPPLGHVAGLCHWEPAIHSPCGRSLRWRLGAHRFENVEVPLGRYRCQDKWKQLRGTAALAAGPRHCVAPGECQGNNAATRVKHRHGPSVTSP